jgi:hypothetical protein
MPWSYGTYFLASRAALTASKSCSVFSVELSVDMHILDCREEWHKPPVLDSGRSGNEENVEIEERVAGSVAVDWNVHAHARRIMSMAVVVVIATMRAYWIHLNPLRRRR